MGRIYTVSMETASVSGAKTLGYLTWPATCAGKLLSAAVAAPDDDTNEQLHLAIQRITTIGTPTGTTLTPAKHDKGDAAATVVSKGDITASEPTYTANTEIGMEGASSLGGYRYEPPEKEALTVSPGESIGLRLLTAPGTPKTLTVRMTFEEIGG